MSLSFEVCQGGAQSLSTVQSQALRRMASLLRSLSDAQAAALMSLAVEFCEDGYLARMREGDIPVVKILGEVISGWDPSGVAEFAEAWASTLVAREDGFDWEQAGAAEKIGHRLRVDAELARRGL
jgi:hypothetical protein